MIWEKCSKHTKNKSTPQKNLSEIEVTGNATNMLKEIRCISLKIETKSSVYDELDEATHVYYTYSQTDDENKAKHLRTFKNIVKAIEYISGTIFADDDLAVHEQKEDNETSKGSLTVSIGI